MEHPSRWRASGSGPRTASASDPCTRRPALRGNGYASGLVGRMTAELLGLHRFCFLFTDLANPTANGIYQRIGYEAVSDVEHYAFV